MLVALLKLLIKQIDYVQFELRPDILNNERQQGLRIGIPFKIKGVSKDEI